MPMSCMSDITPTSLAAAVVPRTDKIIKNGLGVLTVPYVISNSKFGLVSSYFPLKVLKDIFYYLKINTYLSFYKN